MQKIVALSLCCLFLTPAWATQSHIYSLMPMTNQPTQSSPLKKEILPSTYIVKAGGFGGNERIGQLTYSGTPSNLPALNVSRRIDGTCYLMNENVRIMNNNNGSTIQFLCPSPDPDHNDLYWDAYLGIVNGGYSPENDTLYAVDVVTNMYNDWYHIPPSIDENGLQVPIGVRLHANMDNGYLENDYEIVVGDGKTLFYPLTSLSLVSFMISYIFTVQHANFDFYGEPGSIFVAFASMTAMAAEFYVTGKNTWQVGAGFFKSDSALYYLDRPSKDCNGRKPGDYCSVDTLTQYHNGLDVHYGSGLFSRAFYLLATTKGWDTHKAYDIFLHANRYYWNNKTDFHRGACHAIKSAIALGYDTKPVMIAFAGVGIDTRDCPFQE